MKKHIFPILILTILVALPACKPFKGQQVKPQPEAGTQRLDEALAYLDQGLTDSALAAFGMALEENPNLVRAHMGMGDIYLDRGNYDLAENSYERAVVNAPGSFDAHYYLGLTKQLLGKVKEAISTYLKALEIDPDSFDANLNIASAYLQANQPNRALMYARRAVELNSESLGAWANLAAIYSLMGKYEEAVDAYRQAVEFSDDRPEPVLLGLADAHAKLGNYERAINVLNSLIRAKPTATAYERLGYCQFKQRKFDSALASFRAALSIDEDDTASLNGLGVCLMTLYLQSGKVVPSQKENAIEAWRRSIRVNPNQPKIADLINRYQKI